MTPKQIQNYERMLSKPWSDFSESEKRQCESYEQEKIKPKGERKLKRERSIAWGKETSYQAK